MRTGGIIFKMSKSYKTTKKHFKLFKRECRYWLDFFNLGSWRIDYTHKDHPDLDGRAWITMNWVGRCATAGLAVNWDDDKPTARNVCRSGFHETCELLLWMLRIYGEMNATPSDIKEVQSHNHAIVRRLEKAIWEPYWDAR